MGKPRPKEDSEHFIGAGARDNLCGQHTQGDQEPHNHQLSDLVAYPKP